jgi:hypothetical protein
MVQCFFRGRGEQNMRSPNQTWLILAALLGVSCSKPKVSNVAPQEARDRVVVFSGMCDASGAVPLGSALFAVADDEDNVLRIYDAEAGGAPLYAIDISSELPLQKSKKDKTPTSQESNPKKPKKSPESDLEAATRLGDDAFWITSHGRNSAGKIQPARFIFFGTTLPQKDQPLPLVGAPYVHLLDDLLATESLKPFGLEEASTKAPKEPGGLNIEGLTAMPNNESVYLGFRNPIIDGRALVVSLKNPREVLHGTPASFGPPLLLDLGGLGVRSLSWWHGRYLIAAGAFAEGDTARLYTWDGEGAPTALPIDLAGFNIEGFFTPEERDDILLLSDDGSRLVGDTECKRLEDPSQKTFRGVWVTLPKDVK